MKNSFFKTSNLYPSSLLISPLRLIKHDRLRRKHMLKRYKDM